MFYCLKVMNEKNTGDMVCSPLDYFNFVYKHFFYGFIYLDIRENIPVEIHKEDVVIIGGGGLLNYHPDWNERINKVLSSGCKVVFWSPGENNHYDDKRIKPKIIFHENCLLGFRDICKEHFLPCVSCMSEHFDKFKIGCGNENKTGAVCHLESDFGRFCEETELPYIENTSSFFDILQHISKYDIIMTNTYHGVYWSQLMGKKTVIVKPFSTRFNNLPLYSYVINDLSTDSVNNFFKNESANLPYDTNLLRKCRELNENFFEKSKNFIE